MSVKDRQPSRSVLVPPSVQRVLRKTGQPLDSDTRERMETRLGHDFSNVRVHTDRAAADSARTLSAKAYAVGQDLVFGDRQYEVGTHSGQRLIAHELAHVAQQQRGGSGSFPAAEPPAQTAADRVMQGQRVSAESVGRAAVGVYCQPDDDKKKPTDAPVAGEQESTTLPLSKLKLTLDQDFYDPESPAPFLRPPFSLPVGPQIDWLTLRQSYGSRGVPMSERDADSIKQAWDRNSRFLSDIGINDRFKFLFLTKEWLLNKSIAKQVEDQQARENPSVFDRADQEWKAAHPGGFETPIIPLFSTDWLRKKKKKP
jgi:hypothetical protein